MRVPEVLLARINAAAGDERTKWILEACRMRLDGVAGIDKSAVSKGTTGSQTLDTGTNVKSPAEAKEPQTPPKPDMQALRDICAGKGIADVAYLSELDGSLAKAMAAEPARICRECEKPMKTAEGRWACVDMSCAMYGLEQRSKGAMSV